MGKGGGSKQQVTSTQSDISKELRPYREEILGAAQDLFRGGAPEYTSTYVAPSVETLGALSGMASEAARQSPMFRKQQEVLMQNLSGTNPLMQAALKPYVEQAMQPYQSAGRYGSGYAQRAVAEAVAPQLMAAQQQAMAQVPGVYQTSLMPLQTQAQIGAAREELERQLLEEEAMEAQYPYMSQRGLLGDYAGFFSGMPMGQVGQQITPIHRGSPLAGALGGGLSAMSSLAPMLGEGGAMATGGKLAGLAPYAPYAVGGAALLGLLGSRF